MTAARALLSTALIALVTTASPGPDLSGYLAPAPSSDWVDVGSAPGALSGPFTAKTYAEFVAEVDATPNTIEAQLTRDGFIAGYAREWEQRISHNLLAERLFQFGTDLGADSFYEAIRVQSETSPDYRGDVPGAASIPNSFGVLLVGSGGSHQWRIDFRKNNLVFIVHAVSRGEDVSALAVSQAQAEAAASPPPTAAAGRLVGPVGVPRWVLPAMVGLAVFLFLLLVGVVVVVVVVATRPRGAPGIQTSPDGAYWWDGARWRLVATDPPPGRSP